MFKHWLRHKMEMWRLDRVDRRIERAWNKERRNLAAGKPAHTADSIRDYERMELSANQEERDNMETRWLLRQAYRLGIPAPLDDLSAWEDQSGRRVLTLDARAKLRAAIRRERVERWEFASRLLAALTGVIGTLIGLVAMLKK